MKAVTSCGTIVTHDKRFLIIKHSMLHGGHWDFPKGHMDSGESEEEAALRETKEETNIDVEILDGFRETLSYVDHMNNEKKTVVFFLARPLTYDLKPCATEMETAEWLGFSDALMRLSYENVKVILKKANAWLSVNTLA